jgi:hypothetical protein
MSKQIFFKTVQNDYTSVFAIGKYKRKYKVNERYTFDEGTPAHVFGLNDDGMYTPPNSEEKKLPIQNIHHDLIYSKRAERGAGNRVLICYGEVETKRVPVCNIDENWNFSRASYKWRYTSSDFTVIGEIQPKRRDSIPLRRNGYRVIRAFCKGASKS